MKPTLSTPLCLAFFAITLHVGCSSHDPDTQHQSQDMTAQPGAEGGTCGGIGGFECDPGLVCERVDGDHPDSAGKCVAQAPASGEAGGA